MGTTTPNMLLSKPTLGGDPGTWDDQLNASLDRLDLHDHTSGFGVRVPSSGLNINADLTFAGNAATNVKAAAFTAQAAYTTNRSIWVNSGDNELYWRTAGGVDVKITSGTSLNISLVGGIYGDYSTTNAKIWYEDAGKRYKMLQSGPSPDFWASVDCGDLKLYEKASGIVNAVTIRSPAALASGYTVTLPAALPAGKRAMQISDAGVVTFDNAFVGAATFDATVVATGNVTGADLRHTDAQVLFLPAAQWAIPNTSTGRLHAKGHAIELLTHTGAEDTPTAVCGIPLKSGDTITQVVIRLDKTSGAGTVRARLRSYAFGTGITQTHALNTWSAGTNITLSGLTVAAGTDIWIQIEGGGTTGDTVYQVEVSYTRA